MLDPLVIRDVLLSENAEQYMFIYLKDVIFAILNDCDPIYLNEDHISTLDELNEDIKKVEAY